MKIKDCGHPVPRWGSYSNQIHGGIHVGCFAKTLESHTKGDNCNTEIVIATVHTGFVGSTTCADAFGGMLWLLSGQW